MSVALALAASLVLMNQQEIPSHVATTPADRMNEVWWANRHQACREITQKGGVDLVFLGDSITQGWEGGGKKVWDEKFAPLKAANFGFSGDRTEHVLWRLEHGEIIGLTPKVIVIMIGTNNVGHGSSNAEQTADGVRAIVRKLRSEVPKAHILLLSIFPRGQKPTDPMRVAVDDATRRFKTLDEDKMVTFLDLSPHFLNADKTLKMDIMPDALHPIDKGYEIWAGAIHPIVTRLMGD